MNALLEEYLRHYVTTSKCNWVQLLDAAHFVHNLHRSKSNGKSLFKVVIRQQPLTPLDVAQCDTDRSCPVTYRLVRERTKVLQEARDILKVAI